MILPGLMDTPMAVDTRAASSGKSRAEVAATRDAKVPLRNKMGTAWDVANAALFLASDEANFITGVACPSMAARWPRSAERPEKSPQNACGRALANAKNITGTLFVPIFAGTSADAARGSREPRPVPG